MGYQNLSDQLLLTKCSDGDRGAFREIYTRYKEFVFAVVAARLDDEDDAKDITQEIFINLWTARDRLTSLRDFKTYLYVLSRNQVVSAYRKQNTRIKGESYLLERLSEIEYSPEDHKLAVELNTSIVKTVEQLPETMRSCYQLSKNEGKENREIATILNISEKNSPEQCFRSIKKG